MELKRLNGEVIFTYETRKEFKEKLFAFKDLQEANFAYLDMRNIPESPGEEPPKIIYDDLSSCELDFSGKNLRGASFKAAWYNCANFSGAYLYEANFKSAWLNCANFSGAHLEWAIFQLAHLKFASFSGAHLEWANFEGAVIEYTKMAGANIKYANFRGIYDYYKSYDIFKHKDMTGVVLPNGQCWTESIHKKKSIFQKLLSLKSGN